MKTMILLILCAAVAAAAIVGVILYRNNRTGTLTSGILSVTYSSAGGMEGGHYYASVTYDPEKQRAWVEIREQKAHYEKEHTVKREVGEDCIRAIEAILAKENIAAWKDLPPAKVFALDADTASVFVDYEDGSRISFSETQELPEEAFDMMYELVVCMKQYAGIEEKD